MQPCESPLRLEYPAPQFIVDEDLPAAVAVHAASPAVDSKPLGQACGPVVVSGQKLLAVQVDAALAPPVAYLPAVSGVVNAFVPSQT